MTEVTSHVITGCPEELYEFLHNVIQDAQASGSIVNIITIIPTQADAGAESLAQVQCKPKADTCPKT